MPLLGVAPLYLHGKPGGITSSFQPCFVPEHSLSDCELLQKKQVHEHQTQTVWKIRTAGQPEQRQADEKKKKNRSQAEHKPCSQKKQHEVQNKKLPEQQQQQQQQQQQEQEQTCQVLHAPWPRRHQPVDMPQARARNQQPDHQDQAMREKVVRDVASQEHECFRRPSEQSLEQPRQLWKKAQEAMSAPSFVARKDEPLIIFDWDDTLLPTTTLKREGRLSIKAPQGPRDDALAACAAAGVCTLQRAKKLGRVMIITNGMEGWVEASATSMMPELLPELKGVPIVSARSIVEPMGFEVVEWKIHCFAMVAAFLQKQSQQQELKMASIGDGDCERWAARRAARSQLLRWSATTAKLLEQPTIQELTDELHLCTKHLSQLARGDESPLDVFVSLAEDNQRLFFARRPLDPPAVAARGGA